jgi:hypothetical protein
LVCECEVLALVLLGLDAADLVGRGGMVEQCHDQAPDRLQAVAGEPVAGAGGEQPALAGEQQHLLARGAVADAGDELAHRHQHAGEPFDALGGDLAARVGGQFDVVERDAHERARRVAGREGGDVKQRGRRSGRRFGMGHGVLSQEGRVSAAVSRASVAAGLRTFRKRCGGGAACCVLGPGARRV